MSEDQKSMYITTLENINKNIEKNYNKFKFVNNDVLHINILINIHTLSIVIKYQQVYLHCCWYNYKNE